MVDSPPRPKDPQRVANGRTTGRRRWSTTVPRRLVLDNFTPEQQRALLALAWEMRDANASDGTA